MIIRRGFCTIVLHSLSMFVGKKAPRMTYEKYTYKGRTVDCELIVYVWPMNISAAAIHTNLRPAAEEA